MEEPFKKSRRFNHRFSVLQIFSLVISYLILLSPSYRGGKYSYFLFIGLFLLYLEWGINYLLEKIYKPSADGYEGFKSILETWSVGFIGVHISLLILIIAQIRFNLIINVWLIILALAIVLFTIIFLVKGKTISFPSYPVSDKLHKFSFKYRKESFYVFLAGWVVHFAEYPNTFRLIALVIAFIAFIYFHLGNFVNLKELDELERQIKLEQAYLGLPIAMAVFYVSEFLRSTYKLGFSTIELLFAVSVVSIFLSFIVIKKYE